MSRFLGKPNFMKICLELSKRSPSVVKFVCLTYILYLFASGHEDVGYMHTYILNNFSMLNKPCSVLGM